MILSSDKPMPTQRVVRLRTCAAIMKSSLSAPLSFHLYIKVQFASGQPSGNLKQVKTEPQSELFC